MLTTATVAAAANPNVYVPNVHVCVYAHSVLFVCVH